MPRNAVQFRLRRGRRTALLRGGFSFIEILFAVMILGVGFIMIAAIFPVSLSQTRMSNEESFSAAMSRGAQRFIEEVAADTVLPVTGLPDVIGRRPRVPPLVALRPNANRSYMEAEMVSGIDQRYAWVPFFARKNASPFVSYWLFPIQVRALSRFDQPPEVFADPNTGVATIEAEITLDHIRFTSLPPGSEGIGVPGAYVLVSSCEDPNPNAGGDLYNGNVYRLGNQIDDVTFEHYAGVEFVRALLDNDGNPNTPATVIPEIHRAKVFVIGRGRNADGVYEGTGQEIGLFSGVIRLPQYNPGTSAGG